MLSTSPNMVCIHRGHTFSSTSLAYWDRLSGSLHSLPNLFERPSDSSLEISASYAVFPDSFSYRHDRIKSFGFYCLLSRYSWSVYLNSFRRICFLRHPGNKRAPKLIPIHDLESVQSLGAHEASMSNGRLGGAHGGYSSMLSRGCSWDPYIRARLCRLPGTLPLGFVRRRFLRCVYMKKGRIYSVRRG